MLSNIYKLKELGDSQGWLVALEENRDVPFDVRRVFYIYGVQKEASRGRHAHYKTKQFLVAVSGSCKITLDNGKEKEVFEMSKPSLGLLQDAMVWGTMHDFTPDCVLLVLANHYYDANDYIRDYNQFLEALRDDS